MLKPNSPSALCAYCGDPATTDDHVPPQNIFLKPRPSNLVTVPACDACNNGASGDDDKFRQLISFRVGTNSPKTLALWQQGAFGSVLHDKKEMRRIITSMERVALHTKAGIYVGDATQATFEAEPHDRTMSRTARGLYHHEFAEPLPKDCPVEVTMLTVPNQTTWDALAPTLALMTIRNIGGADVFEYAFGRAAEQPDASFWLFRFYERHLVRVTTGGVAHPGG